MPFPMAKFFLSGVLNSSLLLQSEKVKLLLFNLLGAFFFSSDSMKCHARLQRVYQLQNEVPPSGHQRANLHEGLLSSGTGHPAGEAGPVLGGAEPPSAAVGQRSHRAEASRRCAKADGQRNGL